MSARGYAECPFLSDTPDPKTKHTNAFTVEFTVAPKGPRDTQSDTQTHTHRHTDTHRHAHTHTHTHTHTE